MSPAEPAAATTDAPAAPPAAAGTEAWTSFAAWAADELGYKLAFNGSVYRLEPEEFPSEGASTTESTLRRSWIRRRRREAESPPSEPRPEPLSVETSAEVVAAFIERLRERPTPPGAKPTDQPEAVHELTDRLFAAYTLDGGKAHVAGCHLEDTPLMRLTRVTADPEGAPVVTHAVFGELGAPLAWAEAVELGLDRVGPLSDPEPRLDAGRLARMLESARRSADRTGALGDPPGGGFFATVVWAKRATGRLRFEFGDESVDTPFEGWARRLEAPPIVCPQTGRETYHLATVEGGAIAAAEEIAPCEVTGHRHVRSTLERCAATGKLVEPGLLAECPVSGERVLRSELKACPKCGQRVSPAVLSSGDCRGCSATERVGADDERLKKILAKHPKLAGDGKAWSLAETDAAYVLERSGWFRKRVVTIDKATLDVLHTAEASRLSSTWRPTGPASVVERTI